MADEIVIPPELLPADGRFASGPSKVRPEAVAALARSASSFLGTSHRAATVRSVFARARTGLVELFSLPDGYEVIFGVGGTTILWDALVCGFIEHRSHHFVFGEFSRKFADAVRDAPYLSDPSVIESEAGTHPVAEAVDDVDTYALTHNETSTGVAMPVRRPSMNGLVAVDATSAAGGLPVEAASFDLYYFAPQKCFASDGGLWVALASPAAIERIESLSGQDRYVPPSLSLKLALENSRKDQTYNTPGLATVFLFVEQLEWMLASGGLEWTSGRCARSAQIIYEWAEANEMAAPFVSDPKQRSNVVATIDFADSIDAGKISEILRANGILDTEPYRKLGRNQIRVALYPAIEPSDVDLLTRSLDYVVDSLSAESS